MSSWGDQQYRLVRAGSEAEPGADEALIGRGALHEHPVVIAGVTDIDSALAASVEHGGEVLQAKLPVPGMGWSAYFADPDGNTIGLFQVDPSAGGAPDAR